MAYRTFYAVHAIGTAPDGSASFVRVKGVQSVSINTTFNLEELFELGQIEVYEQIEGTPDVEVTVEKLQDGECPMYLRMTQNAGSASLAGRSAKKAALALSIYDDQQDSASGTALSQITMSGLVVSSLTYNFPVEGPFTEQITAVGNHKAWIQAGFTFAPTFPNTDSPAGLGGVNRRQHLLFKPTISNAAANLDANNALTDTNCTILPGNTGGKVQGISSSGTNNKTNGQYAAHLSNISVSTNLGRERLFELGRKTDYYRFVTFPIEVTCEITQISTQGDLVDATEDGVISDGSNLSNQSIRIATYEGLRLNLGAKNKLQSVSYQGGDTGGGNVSVTYSYRNFNSLSVSHSGDVTSALAANVAAALYPN